MNTQGRKFDDRATDFHSGRKVSPPYADRRICACCGQRIVKGYILCATGEDVGEDCFDIIRRADTDRVCQGFTSARQFAEGWKRSTGCNLKYGVMEYLDATVYAG